MGQITSHHPVINLEITHQVLVAGTFFFGAAGGGDPIPLRCGNTCVFTKKRGCKVIGTIFVVLRPDRLLRLERYTDLLCYVGFEHLCSVVLVSPTFLYLDDHFLKLVINKLFSILDANRIGVMLSYFPCGCGPAGRRTRTPSTRSHWPTCRRSCRWCTPRRSAKGAQGARRGGILAIQHVHFF